jgi:hypothetical protein
MKTLIACLLSCATLVADARVIPDGVRAPVNVAAKLYEGCLISKYQMEEPFTQAELKDVKGINDYIQSVDDYCLTWTVIWTKPLVGEQMFEWQKDKIERFNALRGSLLESYAKGLIARR